MCDNLTLDLKLENGTCLPANNAYKYYNPFENKFLKECKPPLRLIESSMECVPTCNYINTY